MREPHSSAGSQSVRRACPERSRRDGWTVTRQLAFLDTLARTRSVTAAAREAGMSRESAYRLRSREPDGLFAAIWKRAFAPGRAVTRVEVDQGHTRAIRLACGAEARNLRLRPPNGQHRDLERATERRERIAQRSSGSVEEIASSAGGSAKPDPFDVT